MKTRNEKILLAVLIGIIFVTVSTFGYKWITRKQAALTLACAEARADQAEAEVDLQKEDLWKQRQAWINKHAPALGNEDTSKAAVLKQVRDGADGNKLEIIEQSLNDVEHSSAGTIIGVTFNTKGTMENICHWLADLQKPENFYAITLLSLKADQDQKSMLCKVQIVRYFKGGS